MKDAIKVILDIADEVQDLLDLQEINLLYAIQEELPHIQLTDITDPESPSGSKDITTAILATATLTTALSPIIVRILNQFKPDTIKVYTIEKTTHNKHGQPEYIRISVYTEEKYNQHILRDSSETAKKPELPQSEGIFKGKSENDTHGLEEQGQH